MWCSRPSSLRDRPLAVTGPALDTHKQRCAGSPRPRCSLTAKEGSGVVARPAKTRLVLEIGQVAETLPPHPESLSGGPTGEAGGSPVPS